MSFSERFSGRILFIILLLSAGIVQTGSAQTGDDRPLYALPPATVRPFTSGSIALAEDGRTLIAANMLNDTVSIIDAGGRSVLAEISVGRDPRSVALTPDNTRALITNRGDGSLSVIDMAARQVIATYPVGLQPYAVVARSNNTAYVSIAGTNEIVHIDLSGGAILARLDVPDSPAGLALWGDFLYVTHLWNGQLSLVYLPRWTLARTVMTGADTSLSQAVAIDPARGLAYVPQSRSNAANPALTYDTAIFPVVNVLRLNDMFLLRESRFGLDTLDRPVNMPFAATYDATRNWLFVVNAGSDDLSVIDLSTRTTRGHVRVGANPRGIALSRDASIAYVHNMIDGSVTLVDTRTLQSTDVLPISDLTIPIDAFIGAQLFHSANDPRMSRDGWLSCASCHFDGESDGRVWAGFPDGPRVTPALYGLLDTAPYNHSGTWDDLTGVEAKIRALMAGEGLHDGPLDTLGAGSSLDLDTLVMYLNALDGPASPPGDVDLIARGAALFETLECAACHAGEARTDGEWYDVGTGGDFVTPSLNWLWLSAPYFHDGRAETLRDVFLLPGTHQIIGPSVAPDDIDALAAYLLSLPE